MIDRIKYKGRWSSEMLRTKFWGAHMHLTRRIKVTHDDYSQEVRDAFAKFTLKARANEQITQQVFDAATLTPVKKPYVKKVKL